MKVKSCSEYAGFVKGEISFISNISVANVYPGLLREGLKVSEAVRDDFVMQHFNMRIHVYQLYISIDRYRYAYILCSAGRDSTSE